MSRAVLVCLLTAGALAGCNVGSYEDAVDQFNRNAPPPAPPPPPPPPPPPAGFGPNFSEIQASVFTPDCATSGCHSGGSPSAGLNLEAANSYAQLVGIASTQDPGVQRVNPGNPNQSYLITKLEGPGAAGGQMPPSGPMAQADIDVIRQWITDGAIDDTVVPNNPIRITTITPAPNADLTAAPTQIVVGFDREVDATSVDLNSFLVESTGGDGIFGNGNDASITAASITVPAANPQSAVFDLTGVALADDIYRVTLLGSGNTPIMDLGGNILDGEYMGVFPTGNGVQGGDFVVQFTLTTPIVLGPTLTQIQAVIFGPTCATANCHSGAVPDAGLDLSDEMTSRMNLVGVPTTQLGGAGIRVISGDPDNSYLIQKLENAPGIEGVRMPLGAPALPQADIDVIRQWITDGVP
ncbi:MAG: hypothetical protein GTN98_08535 [Woeseiaceae bacterium]|nr:hypothetical protein [Woeseiaceae bacterium]